MGLGRDLRLKLTWKGVYQMLLHRNFQCTISATSIHTVLSNCAYPLIPVFTTT